MQATMVTGLLLGAAISGMAGLRLWRDRRAPGAETLRKAMHVWTGCIALAFPWVFDVVWPPLLIAGAGGGILLASRRAGRVCRWLGGVVDGVGRRTHGEFYFLAAVAVLVVLAGDDPLLYAVPLLVLMFADAAAALVGRTFGRRKYAVGSGHKSFEGSAAFFIVAVLCIFFPLAGAEAMGILAALGCALAIALVATAIEGLSPDGLDNLSVPLAVLGLLHVVLP